VHGLVAIIVEEKMLLVQSEVKQEVIPLNQDEHPFINGKSNIFLWLFEKKHTVCPRIGEATIVKDKKKINLNFHFLGFSRNNLYAYCNAVIGSRRKATSRILLQDFSPTSLQTGVSSDFRFFKFEINCN
jgi:hypothetical protein